VSVFNRGPCHRPRPWAVSRAFLQRQQVLRRTGRRRLRHAQSRRRRPLWNRGWIIVRPKRHSLRVSIVRRSHRSGSRPQPLRRRHAHLIRPMAPSRSPRQDALPPHHPNPSARRRRSGRSRRPLLFPPCRREVRRPARAPARRRSRQCRRLRVRYRHRLVSLHRVRRSCSELRSKVRLRVQIRARKRRPTPVSGPNRVVRCAWLRVSSWKTFQGACASAFRWSWRRASPVRK
jgi:hypothetical protein